MPTHQYRREKCGKKFDVLILSPSMKPRNRRPKCGSKKVSFVPGRFHQSSGRFPAEILEVGPFQVVTTDNGRH